MGDMVLEVMGSKGMIRVLLVMSESGELNISGVSRRTGLNHYTVQRHLEKLMRLGLVQEKRYGKIRIFEVCFRVIRVVFERGRPVTFKVQD